MESALIVELHGFLEVADRIARPVGLDVDRAETMLGAVVSAGADGGARFIELAIIDQLLDRAAALRRKGRGGDGKEREGQTGGVGAYGLAGHREGPMGNGSVELDNPRPGREI